MQTRFLCPSHRNWLNNHPEFARLHFYQCLGATQHHRKGQAWSRALGYAGGAFEAAEILLNKNPQTLHPIVSFTSAAILLSSTFNKLNNRDAALQVLHLSYQRLNRELVKSDENRLTTLFKCIALVSSHVRDLWQDFPQSEPQTLPVNATRH